MDINVKKNMYYDSISVLQRTNRSDYQNGMLIYKEIKYYKYL